jgi:hypothetical protein
MSASGKSTLTARLRRAGYDARPVSQEHSNVPDLWKKFDFPQVLIFLDASLEAQQMRRPDVSWDASQHAEEAARLSHARDHADLRIDTTQMTAEDAFTIVAAYLQKRRMRRAEGALPTLGETGAPVKRGRSGRAPHSS